MSSYYKNRRERITQYWKDESIKDKTYNRTFTEELKYVSDIINRLSITQSDSNNTYLKRSVNKKVNYVDVINNISKLFTFIMPVKNRSRRALLSINTIVNEKNTEYANFIIVEDISDDLIEIPNEYKDIIDYHLVNTGDGWSKTKLINYGIKKSTTPLIIIWDADFLFPVNFMNDLIKIISDKNIKNQYFGIPSYETNNSSIRRVPYNQGESYGNLWIYPRESLLDVGGMDENINGWGFEERELEYRLEKYTDIRPIYTYPLNDKLKVFHYSHGDEIRSNDIKINNINNIKINSIKYSINEGSVIYPYEYNNSMYIFSNKKNNNLTKMKDSIIVVGNGYTDIKRGHIIDQYGTVVRFNHFEIKGYEEFVGTKTDIIFGVKHLNESVYNDADKVIIPHPQSQKIPPSMIHIHTQIEEKLEYFTEEFHKYCIDKYDRPSSGIRAIEYFLKENEHITITGFDGFKTNHYFGSPCGGYEDGDREMREIKKLISIGKITMI